jgi:hypothetical protein
MRVAALFTMALAACALAMPNPDPERHYLANHGGAVVELVAHSPGRTIALRDFLAAGEGELYFLQTKFECVS